MNKSSVKECLLSLKPKNSIGLDRISKKELLEGVSQLITPPTGLNSQRYFKDKCQTCDWSLKKISTFKNKDQTKVIENYRPFGGICATSNIFEKFILKQIMEIQDLNRVDLVGHQHL
jgi:hypothetical protein